MTNSKIVSVGLIVVVLIAIGGYVYPEAGSKLGALVGPDVYDKVYLRGGVEVGGGNLATSSIGAATYTAAQVFKNKLITHTAASALTVTLPASSTVSQISGSSMSHTLFLTPVTTHITVAGGTGTELNLSAGTTSAVCFVGQLCRLDFVRKANTDIEVLLSN